MYTDVSVNSCLPPTYSTEPNCPFSVLSAHYCSSENHLPRPRQSSRVFVFPFFASPVSFASSEPVELAVSIVPRKSFASSLEPAWEASLPRITPIAQSVDAAYERFVMARPAVNHSSPRPHNGR
jgi:hypothetical protein